MKNSFILLLFMLISSMAMATISPILEQSKYRWRNNNGNEATATWKAAENTAITLTDANETLRLRAEYYSSFGSSTLGHFIAYSKDGGTTWRTVTESDTNDFMLVVSTVVNHGDNTTNQLGTSSGGTYTAGKVISQANPSMTMTIGADERMEVEWVIKPTLFVQNSTTYLFENRSVNVTNMQAVLNTDFNCTMPALTVPPSIERCGSGTVTLTGSLNTSGGTIIWRSAPTGGTLLGIGTSVTSPPYTGNTTVYAKGTKDGCTTAGQAVNIVIKSNPVVDLGNDLDTCTFAARPMTLDAGAQPAGTSFAWDDNSTGAQRQVNQSGTYSVRVTSPNGCKSEDTINIIMREKPAVELNTDGTSLCIGHTKILDAGPGGQNGGSYYWNTGELSQLITIHNPGTYIAQVTANNNCINADTIEIVANGYAPVVGGLLAQAQGGSTFKFTAVEPEHVLSYAWDFGDGSAISTDPSPAYTYNSNGVFNARLKISSSCADAWDSVQVNIIGVGINDPDADSRLFNVYPNPNRDGNLNIEVMGTARIENILIRNLSGQEVGRFELEQGQAKYQLSLPASLSGGLYHLLIQTDKGMVVKKINLLR